MTTGSTYAQRAKSLEERFWEKVEKRDGCWLWRSAIGSRGYGIFWVGNGKSRGAHQVAYLLARGEIPIGRVVMHTCDNPGCVNPAHLSVGTVKDNSTDSKNKRRHAHGERNGGGGKLTEAAVQEIKRLSSSRALSITGLSAKFGVSVNTIKQIRRGRLWSHVQP